MEDCGPQTTVRSERLDRKVFALDRDRSLEDASIDQPENGETRLDSMQART